MQVTKRYCAYVGAYPQGYSEDGIDLSGVVFYVGCSTMRGKTTSRFSSHESEARRGGASPKCGVIRKIWRAGMKVCWLIIYETENQGMARAQERYYVQEVYATTYLTNGQLNIVPGPIDLEQLDREWREKQRKLEEKRKHDRETRLLLAKGGIYHWR